MIRIIFILIFSGICFGVNDFSGDETVVALWKFDNGALTTDSISTNTLNSNGTPTADTSIYKEGDASVDLISTSEEFFDIADASLTSDFPYKNGSANAAITVCVWHRFDTTGNYETLCCKWETTSGNRRSFLVWKNNLDVIAWFHGYNSGINSESVSHASTLSAETWYHIAVTLDASENYRIRVHTEVGLLGSDITGTFGNATAKTVAELNIGTNDAGAIGATYVDGKIDEMVIFGRALNTDEIDQIWSGTFGHSSILPILQTQQRRRR